MAARYRESGRFAHGYVAGKLRHDPVYAALLALAPAEGLGDVLDLGCGRGQLGLALLEAGLARSVIAMDWSASHLAQAGRAASGLAFRGERRDLTRPGNLPRADTILLIDVLYQLDTASQQVLVAAAADSARQQIVIRTGDPARGLRSMVARGLEVMVRPFWPHSGACVNAQPPATIAAILAAHGFAVSAVPCWGSTPFANILLHGVHLA